MCSFGRILDSSSGNFSAGMRLTSAAASVNLLRAVIEEMRSIYAHRDYDQCCCCDYLEVILNVLITSAMVCCCLDCSKCERYRSQRQKMSKADFRLLSTRRVAAYSSVGNNGQPSLRPTREPASKRGG